MLVPSYRHLFLTSATMAAAVAMFAIPASASADASPPVLGGTEPSATRSAAPLGGNSPDALGYTEPTPAQLPVIYPAGTVIVSDGMGGMMPAFDRP